MLQEKSGVYLIEIKGNNLKYIGSSKNLYVRKNTHFNGLKRNNHSNQHLQNSFNKYGEENYSFTVLELIDIELLIKREQYYIDTFGMENLYNVCKKVGDTSKMITKRKGQTLSEKHKENISKAMKGRVMPEQTKHKIRKSHLGKKLSKEHIYKMRETMKESMLGSNRNDNTTGHAGVHRINKTGKFRVRIRNKSYGCFNCIEDATIKAKEVYADLKINLGGVSSQ